MEANKNELLLQMDNLARQLFISGFDFQSVLMRGAFNELSLRNITPRLDEIKVCAVKNHKAWAEDNGFELIKVVLDASPDPMFAQIFDPAHDDPFISWKSAIETYFSKQNADFYVIRATDAIVSHVKSFGRWDIFSSSYDILLDEERVWLRYLDGKGVFRAITSDLTKALIDFTGSRMVTITGRCAFIGSIANWGHWMQDFLARIAAFETLPDNGGLKLVFGHLSRNQKSCLTLLGIPQERIIELDLVGSPGEAVRYYFDDLIWIPEIPNKPAANNYLRKRFAAADVGIPTSQPELVYISRRSQKPRHRVFNIDEVEQFFRAKGFVVLDNLEEFDTGNLVSLLRKAKIIALASGADLGTLTLCREDAVAMLLLSDEFIAYADPTILPYWVGPIYGFGLPVVVVAGKAVHDNASSHPRGSVEQLADYRLDDLDRAFDRAIEFSAITCRR